jgi:tRNA(fMet)-specific endonuclease VapC
MEDLDVSDIKISSIVAAELIYGAYKSAKVEYNLSRFKKFLSLYEIIPFDGNTVNIYGEIRAELERKGKVISGNDMLIAATVLVNNGILVTNNTNEFSRIDNLILEDWTEV